MLRRGSDGEIIYSGNAESFKLEADEAGWEVRITTDEGDTFTFNIHGISLDVMEEIDRGIQVWWREGQRLAAEHDYDLARDMDRGK